MPPYSDDHVLSNDGTPIEFINKHEETLFHEARLGEEAGQFLETDLGKLLQGRAILDIEDAQNALLSADPENPAAIRELQFKAAVARQFVSWIAEAISNGNNAYDQLRSIRSEQ